MPALYFMNRQFDGKCLALDESLESGKIQLLFEDSWYWLHYRFFNCRDRTCSESSSAVRTHLFNFAAMLYRSFEAIPSITSKTPAQISEIISELIAICEYSREFPVSLWIAGDDSSKECLNKRLTELPTNEQIEHLLRLPHFKKMEEERLSYRHNAEELALKRFRQEEAAYNKRQKLALKNEQRSPQ